MVSPIKTSLQQGCVVFAKNKKRVSAFYQQTLGLAIEESGPSHDLLRGNGYEVVVHAIPRKYAAAIKLARPIVPREEMPFKPTFVVGDLDEVRIAATKSGGYLKPKQGAWHFRGCIVLDGWGPRGQHRSVQATRERMFGMAVEGRKSPATRFRFQCWVTACDAPGTTRTIPQCQSVFSKRPESRMAIGSPRGMPGNPQSTGPLARQRFSDRV